MPPASQSKSNSANNSLDWFATQSTSGGTQNYHNPNLNAKLNVDPFASLIGVSADAPLPNSGLNDFNSFNTNSNKSTSNFGTTIQNNQYANSYNNDVGFNINPSTQATNNLNNLDFSGLNIGQSSSVNANSFNNANIGVQSYNYAGNAIQQTNFAASQNSGLGNINQNSNFSSGPIKSTSNNQISTSIIIVYISIF